ncbi:hypothetical protein OAP14_05735 [Aliiglaciecola sp.]|nr:hypothetical protein [Aliiglaciecola sp.]
MLNKREQQSTDDEQSGSSRRDFIQKFGKFAAVTPIAMSALMSPSTSAAPKSCRGNGTYQCRNR